MPFGLRKPLEYTRPGRTIIQPANYAVCPVCSKPLKVSDKGYTPVAPCLIPLNNDVSYDLIVILGCQSCYLAQNKLGFVTLEQLQEYQINKTVRMPSKPSTKLVKTPKSPKASGIVHRSLSSDDLVLLSQAYDLIGRILNKAPEINIGRCDSEESDLSRRNNSQGLPDYDIEFGMTDEQRQRMDKAVHDAAERTKLVPSEGWAGKTAEEILANVGPNGVPDGW